MVPSMRSKIGFSACNEVIRCKFILFLLGCAALFAPLYGVKGAILTPLSACVYTTILDPLNGPLSALEFLIKESVNTDQKLAVLRAHTLIDSPWSLNAFASLYQTRTGEAWRAKKVEPGDDVVDQALAIVTDVELKKYAPAQVIYLQSILKTDETLNKFIKEWINLTVELSPDGFRDLLRIALFRTNFENQPEIKSLFREQLNLLVEDLQLNTTKNSLGPLLIPSSFSDLQIEATHRLNQIFLRLSEYKTELERPIALRGEIYSVLAANYLGVRDYQEISALAQSYKAPLLSIKSQIAWEERLRIYGEVREILLEEKKAMDKFAEVGGGSLKKAWENYLLSKFNSIIERLDSIEDLKGYVAPSIKLLEDRFDNYTEIWDELSTFLTQHGDALSLGLKNVADSSQKDYLSHARDLVALSLSALKNQKISTLRNANLLLDRTLKGPSERQSYNEKILIIEVHKKQLKKLRDSLKLPPKNASDVNAFFTLWQNSLDEIIAFHLRRVHK